MSSGIELRRLYYKAFAEAKLVCPELNRTEIYGN
jgi:hypothetical protein